MLRSVSRTSTRIQSTIETASRRFLNHRCQQPHHQRRLCSTYAKSRQLTVLRTTATPTPLSSQSRFFSASSDDASNNGGGSRLGTWLIRLGWGLLGLVAVDQVLQYKQEQEGKERMQMLIEMQQEANEMNRPEWDKSLPSLFQCKIAYVEPSLDGTKMLANIRVGDVVEIVEAKVGPNQAYHLCRRPAQGRRPESMGWYPVEFLENV
mmetsp:Transcript_16474/g.40237  ORF Transcript_16474/g.40237 Transcript_16474/m.40237 type:complete len:207 (+) Transcript_16474:109-729(+)